MQDYNSLPPKQKFIRSCIAVPVYWVILILFWVFCAKHFTLGAGFLIKAGIVSVIVVIIRIIQLVTTFLAWKNSEDTY